MCAGKRGGPDSRRYPRLKQLIQDVPAEARPHTFAFRGELPSYSTAARLDNGMPSVPVPDVPGLEGAHKVGPHALAQRTQRPEVLNRTGLEQPPLRIWYRQNRPG